MPNFKCLPVATSVQAQFRTGRDQNDNAVREITATATGAPCRHCLRNAQAGEPMLLGSYNLIGPQGIYWTPSPIFVHAEPCPQYDQVNHIPDIVRTSLVSVRSYDESQMCLYDLGQAIEGQQVDPVVARAVSDPRTSFINIHTAKPGCLLCRVELDPGAP